MSAGDRLSLPAPSEEDRRRALADPGVGWRDWFFRSLLRVYAMLGFLIVDVWLVGGWIQAGLPLGILPTLPPALYAEFVLFQYLWAKPRGDPSHSVRSEWRRTWLAPFEFGRLTPEGQRIRRGLPPYGEGVRPSGEPDPTEFF